MPYRPEGAALRRLSLLMCCALLALPLAAQPLPMKWGTVPREDLEMSAYPADTNAVAVILADYGEVEFTPDYEILFHRHRRIKLLSEAAYGEWGTVEIPYYTPDAMQRVNDVQGLTFNLTEGGKVERHKLDGKSIFREDVNGEWKRVRFTLPALRPGSVIEYRYTLVSRNPIFLTGWNFQHEEPVRWSEFRAQIPRELQYVSVSHTTRDFDLQEAEPVLRAGGSLNGLRWVMRDMPALREEPYMTTPEDYRAKIRFQLAAYALPGIGVQKVMETWEKLASDLVEETMFGRQLDRHRALRAQAEELTAGLTDPEAKLRAVYDYVRTTMTVNDLGGLYADQEIDRVLRARAGSATEIALVLTSLLRNAGLEANPLLISTREHGQPVKLYPILTQFDRVITHVRIGSREFLLDATDPLRPYDLLPVEALNGAGYLVSKDAPRWVNVGTQKRYRHSAQVKARLTAEGGIEGLVETSDAEYAALRRRHALPATEREEYLRKQLLPDLPAARLDSFVVGQQDSLAQPLLLRAHFTAPDYAQAAGDFLYLNPVLADREEKNPLTLAERSFPVDFAHPIELSYNLELALPEGYAVHEQPQNVQLQLPSEGGRFRRVTEVEGNTVRMLLQFSLRKAVYEPRAYRDLRAFYDRVVAAHADQLVLRRTTAESN